MDNDELFENFNISSYDNSIQNSDTKNFLSKKRKLEHEQEQEQNKPNKN